MNYPQTLIKIESPFLFAQKSIIICSARMRCKIMKFREKYHIFGKKVAGIENNSYICILIVKGEGRV